MKNYIQIFMALSTIFVLVVTTSQASNYELTIIGTLGGDYYSAASDINDSGQVVGSSHTEAGHPYSHAFLWENGVMTDLGTLPGDNTSGARSINNNGLIVGISGFTDEYGYGNYSASLGINDFTDRYGYGYYNVGISDFIDEYGHGNYNACLWKNGIPVDLGITTWAEDIDDSGQIVGGYLTWEYNLPAWLWENGVITYLGTMVEGQESVATAINNSDQVVGYANIAQPGTSDRLNACIWEDGEMKTLENLPGPTDNRPYTQATDINDKGQVVGRAARRVFLWKNGNVTWLTQEAGTAHDINNKGQVVGQANFLFVTADGYADVASIWSSGLWYQNGASRGWTQVSPAAPDRITAGDITGDGRDEIIGCGGAWSSGIWYRDVAKSKWTNINPNTPIGDITAGDFNGDGKADVASTWDSGLWWKDVAASRAYRVYHENPYRLTAGDITGDGVDELISTWNSGILYWDVAKSKWTKMTSYTTQQDIAAGDFTGDGKADVASCWSSGLWYQNGANLGWTKVTSTAPYTVTAGDVTDGGIAKIIGTWSSGIWYWHPEWYEWTKMTSYTTDRAIAAGDFTGEVSKSHAFLWDSTNGLQDLNDLIPAGSGWILTGAAAINENGQIVGSAAMDSDGDGKWDAKRGFLLTPK